jgi:hypothetical protein
MSRSRKKILLALLVPFVVLVSWIAYHETRVPQNQEEVLTRMIELQREGRYDKEVVQNSIKEGRRDIAHGGSMYDQIAMS